MVDAHCHLYELENSDTEIQRFKDEGGKLLICAGASIEGSKKAVDFANKYGEVFATVGVHPEELSNIEFSVLGELSNLIKDKKVVAIGETGIDKYENEKDKKLPDQLDLFEAHINLAEKNKLPLVVHCRNAFSEIYERVKNKNLVGMLHCFTGNTEWMNKFVELGWYISFGGIVTFKSSHELREVVRKTPVNRILSETDSPWLSPEPFRGTKNSPWRVKYVVECLATTLNLEVEVLNTTIEENARLLFRI